MFRAGILAVTLFFSAVPAWAQEATQQTQLSFGKQLIAMTPMFAMVFAIFYFLVLLPQKKQLKQQIDFISTLKKGEQVVTSGGMIGKIASIEDATITLDFGNNNKIQFEKSHIKKRVGEA